VNTNRLHRTMKISEEGRTLIENLIGNDVSVTLLDLKKKLLEQLNLHVLVTSINKVITTLNFTFKRVQLIPHS